MTKDKNKKIDDGAWAIINALNSKNPESWKELDVQSGRVIIDGSEVYPEELIDFVGLERLIDKNQYYQSMSGDARAIVHFVCFSDKEVLERYCGSGQIKKVTANRIAKFFRHKWGRKRVKAAFEEIKKLVEI